MATATHAGPIDIEQINATFYVTGRPDGFTTIQEAVDFVRLHNGSSGVVVVGQGVNVADDISAVTGGGANILILDNRAGRNQRYQWDGTNFVPLQFVQKAGFSTTGLGPQILGSTAMDFNPNGGVNGAGGGGLALLANAGKGIPFFAIQMMPGDGSVPEKSVMQIGEDLTTPGTFVMQILEKLRILTTDDTTALWIGQQETTGGKGMEIVAKQGEDSIVFQGLTVGVGHDQALRFNPTGGDVQIGEFVGVKQAGDITGVGKLTASGQIVAQGFSTTGLGPQILGSTAMDFNPNGGVNNAGGGSISLLGSPGKGIPFFSILMMPGDGSLPEKAVLQIGEDLTAPGTFTLQILEKLKILAPDGTEAFWLGQQEDVGGKGLAITADPSNDIIFIEGRTEPTTYDQTISLNRHGGDVLVNNSPVRTFANSPGGGGMEFPPEGIGVSLGDAWDVNSIDPATLATYPAAGIPVSTGSAWGTPIAPATVPRTNISNNFTATQTVNGSNVITAATLPEQVYPGVGLAVSTGTTWGTPIDPADLPRLSKANTFAQAQTFSNNIGVQGDEYVAGISHLANGHILVGLRTGAVLTGAPNFCTDNTNLYLNSAANGFTYFNFDQSGKGVKFFDGSGTGALVASIDSAGVGSFSSLHIPPMASNFHYEQAPSYGLIYESYGVNTGNLGSHTFRSRNSDGSITYTPIIIYGDHIDVVGNFAVTGGTKAFKVTHPLDDTKELWHACLEGPENGVYYRGEVTTVNGKAEVTLPDYFEALTFEDDRSVQLTQVAEPEGARFTMLAASRVKDGKFTVITSEPSATVAWEVKAVRKIGVDRLEVTRAKAAPVQ